PAPPESPHLSLHDALPFSRPTADSTSNGTITRNARSGSPSCASGFDQLERANWRAGNFIRRPANGGTHSLPGTPARFGAKHSVRSEEHTSELQSRFDLVCR